MDATHATLNRVASASRLLGWINFSDGRPDPKWQRQLDDVHDAVIQWGAEQPWQLIKNWLLFELDDLERSGNAAFRDSSQARAAIPLVFDQLMPAYRKHHSDLLGHLSDTELFTAFFVARLFESVLAQGSPWDQGDRIIRGALKKLNDFVGHRPIAVLESRPQTDLYPHERVRPVPIYIKGAGVAHGPYRDMVTLALEILEKTDPDILHEACFDPALLDELAFDPRPYDHGHPVNRRPNYLFGEWDPHHIDDKGRYRRFVVRKTTLDAVLTRVPLKDTVDVSRAERIRETGAVLAGTILMAAGTSGAGPTYFDSTVTLSKLVPRIARYRDAFYKRLIAGIGGEHGQRLQVESQKFRQPFGAARQHLNQELARQRAIELQESHLALLFAEMGYPEASRRRAASITAVSVRMLAEMRLRLASGRLAVEKNHLTEAATLLAECEELLHRGIACGAIADPWNALGFQGLFPLFQSREDSVRDGRLDELMETVSRIFHLYSDLLSSAASAGDDELGRKLTRNLERFAAWWDQHATFEVSDLPRVHGGERAAAAAHVAKAIAGVRGSSASANDLAFWRQHRDGFRAPAAFAQVVDALLRRGNHRAAMALLMTWLSDASEIPLEEGEDSFHALARRWLREVIEAPGSVTERVPLVTRFFAHLEANADELWSVPELNGGGENNWKKDDDEDDVFQAAYEEMSYRDSTDDGEEGSVAGGNEPRQHFSLEEEADRLEDRLEFLATAARLWQESTPFLRPHVANNADLAEAVNGWLAAARSWQAPLIDLLERLHELKIPEPVGGFEDVMEFDRRRMLREQLAESVIETALETGRAVRLLGGLASERPRRAERDPGWEPMALRLEAALGDGEPGAVRKLLPRFLAEFRTQPLLFVPMSAGGHPLQILRSRQAQTMLRSLLEQLPRLGLIRETYHLIQIAKTMEQNAPPEGRKISEFDHLFPIALQSVLDALLDAAHSWPPDDLEGDEALVDLLRRITDSFLTLWLGHSQTLRLSVLESPPPGSDWEGLHDFVKTYGGDLFSPQFLAMANLRSVLHRGVDNWLDSLGAESEPPKLWEHIQSGELDRGRASALVEYVVQAMIEHHEEYRDYNSTTTQSDYGENLHLLLDFLKIKSNYDRYAWRMRPLVQAHAVLCRRGQDDAAVRWQANMASFTRAKVAEPLLADLTKLEEQHGLKLRTVRDRLEERFVRPLVIDRLCSQVEPAMREAADPPKEGGAFARLEDQLHLLTDKPIGIGLDAPEWLERLENEVEAVRKRMANGERPPKHGLAPGVTLKFADLQRQLAEWDKPL